MKGILTLVILAAISVGVFALGSLRKETDGKPILHVAKEAALTVNTAKPEQGEIIRLVEAPGDVEAVLEVEISSELVSKITFMPVEEGDVVKEGDLLCRLDDKNLLADLASATERISQLQAAVLVAEADLDKAARDVARQASLSETAATTDLEVRDYLTIKKKAAAVLTMRGHELAQAEAGRQRIEEDLKKTVLTSPIDGVISKLNAKQGEVVVTGTMNNAGTVIMSISDLSRMQVRTRIDEVDIPLVGAGQNARVYLQADPDVPVAAEVIRVASKGTKAVGRDLVTFEALLAVHSDDKRIKPGMTANVEIEVDRRDNAIAVPIEAVVHRMRKDLPESLVKEFDETQGSLDLSERAKRGQYIDVLFVMVDGVAKVRLVDGGIADTRRLEVRRNISMDDQIITGPYRSLDQLEDGKKVALAEDDKKKDKSKPDADEATAKSDAKDEKDGDGKEESDEKSKEEDTRTAAASAP
jgi:HlyD family secretion protein